VHTVLQQLIGQSCKVFPVGDDERIELVAACFLYAYLGYTSAEQRNDRHNAQLTFQDLSNAIRKAVNFSAPLKVCRKSRPELEGGLDQFVKNIEQLIQSKAISNFDLSKAIKELYRSVGESPIIPTEVCHLITGLLGSRISTVYCPFGKSIEFALHLPKHAEATVEAETKDDIFYAKAQSTLLNKPCPIIENDPIENPKLTGDGGLQQFDAVVSMPPFGAKVKSKAQNDIWGRFPESSLMGEVYFLRHMLAHTEERVICVVSNAFLYRSAAGERAFKEDMIENNWLEGVIALPTGLLSDKSIGINVLVLNKAASHRRIKFLDASGDKFFRKLSKNQKQLVGIESILKAYGSLSDTHELVQVLPYEVEENEYNLSPSRYVSSEEDKKLYTFLSSLKTDRLDKLVDIIRPQALMDDEQGHQLFHEYGLSSLNEIGHLTGQPRVVSVNKKQVKRAEKQQIQPNDVLVVCKGGVGQVGFVPDNIKQPAVANQAFAILRVKERCRRMTPEALFQYLLSDYGKYHLKSLATGTTSLILSSKDLSNITVPALNKEQQRILEETHRQVVEKHKKIIEIKKNMKDLSINAIDSLGNYI